MESFRANSVWEFPNTSALTGFFNLKQALLLRTVERIKKLNIITQIRSIMIPLN